MQPRTERIKDIAAVAVLCGIVLLLYLRLPKQGDIWWMDASRHALNGAFVLDFLRTMPTDHPFEFALDYYRQWPALTIGFYPPLFSVVLAVCYALFGVSEAAALIGELLFMLALGCGVYRLARNWLAAAPSAAVAILLIGAPEVYYWGQQVMLDVPSYALLVWSAVFLLRYLDLSAERSLYVAVTLCVLAIYTKYNSTYFALVMGMTLLCVKGRRLFVDRTALQSAGLGALLLLPLLIIFYKFSAFNLDQAISAPDAVTGRWTFAALTYYARIMGAVVSWPVLLLAVCYYIAMPFVPWLRLRRADQTLLLTWLIIGYCFYSLIAVKEPRHIVTITLPIVLGAVLLLDRGLGRFALHGFAWHGTGILTFAFASFGLTVVTRPVPYVTGVRQAAQDVARVAPFETNIAFWGRLDGTFIYAMRAYTGREDLGVVRLDKLLLTNVAVSLEWGFREEPLDAAQIVAELEKLHVQYVVVQTHYRDDMGVVRELQDALASPQFTEVSRVPMAANYPFSSVSEFIIYRAAKEMPRGWVAPSLEVKIMQKRF